MENKKIETEEDVRREIDEEVWIGVSYPMLDKKSEKEVRRSLAKGEYGDPATKGHDFVLSWLENERSARESSTSRWARHAAYAAYTAAIIAAVSIIIQIFSTK